MSTWVEYHKIKDVGNNTWAQMKEQTKWVEPNRKDISFRYFDDPKNAWEFANRMGNQGYHAVVKQDRSN